MGGRFLAGPGRHTAGQLHVRLQHVCIHICTTRIEVFWPQAADGCADSAARGERSLNAVPPTCINPKLMPDAANNGARPVCLVSSLFVPWACHD
jgi:hypothetical protein